MGQKSVFYRLFILVVVITSLSVSVTALVLTDSNAKVYLRRINVQAEEDVRDLHKKIELQLENMASTIHLLSLSNAVKGLNVSEIQTLMEDVSKTSPYLFLYVTDVSGMQLYKTYGELIDISDRAYFKKAIQGESNFSDVIVSRTQGHPVVIYAQPIRQSGEIVGIIAGAIDVSYLSEINGVAMEKGRISYIVDSTGTVVVHPDNDLVQSMSDFSNRPYVTSVLQGEDATGHYLVNGKTKLISYMPIEPLNGGVIVEMEAEEAFGTVDKMMNQAVLIIIFVVFIGASITYAIVKPMTKSLGVLKRQVNLLAEGRTDFSIDEQLLLGNDEISSLARDFQRIAIKNQIIAENVEMSDEKLNRIIEGFDDHTELIEVKEYLQCILKYYVSKEKSDL